MTQYYVRATGGSDSNGGTSHADAWATIQKALDTMVHDKNQCNLNGEFTLSATLDLTTFGNDTEGFVFRGYTAKADDGGIATINGGGNAIFSSAGNDNLIWRDLKFAEWGTGLAIQFDSYSLAINCEFDGGGARVQSIQLDEGSAVIGCKIHNMISTTQNILRVGQESLVMNNYVQSTGGVGCFGGRDCKFVNNVVSLNSTGSGVVGISVFGNYNTVFGNSVFNQAAGTGAGIKSGNASYDYSNYLNNIVCGFSGTGGVGIHYNGSDSNVYGFNKFWNNATDLSLSGGRQPMDLGSNTALGANPFKSTGNVDPNDDDFELNAALEGFPLDLYDPGGLYSGNQGYLDAGALFRVPTAALDVLASGAMQHLPRRREWRAVPYQS